MERRGLLYGEVSTNVFKYGSVGIVENVETFVPIKMSRKIGMLSIIFEGSEVDGRKSYRGDMLAPSLTRLKIYRQLSGSSVYFGLYCDFGVPSIAYQRVINLRQFIGYERFKDLSTSTKMRDSQTTPRVPGIGRIP